MINTNIDTIHLKINFYASFLYKFGFYQYLKILHSERKF